MNYSSKIKIHCFFSINHIQTQFKINVISLIDGAVSCQLYIQIQYLLLCSKLLLSRVKNRYQKKEGYLSNFKGVFFQFLKMAFTFAAFSYIVALIVDAFLIFFAIFHVSHLIEKQIFNMNYLKNRNMYRTGLILH